MKQFFSEIKSVLYNRDNRLRKRLVFSLVLCLIGLSTGLWVIIRTLFYDGNVDSTYKLNYPVIGQFGDFIGGFIGTVFSIVGIILLYETLALQRYESEETRKTLKQSQFENTFFALLKIYQEALSKVGDRVTPSVLEDPINGLEYFHFKRQQLYQSFQPSSSILKRSKLIRDTYTQFYLDNKTNLSVYFRTLYRLFKFIEDSKISEKDKIEYSKIVRAQLNEDELYFIYYNAFSNFGENFRPLINKYRITKHLPLFSKLEYKGFTTVLNTYERNSVEYIFEELKRDIRKKIIEGKGKYSHREYLSGKYKFTVHGKESELKLIITVNRTQEVQIKSQTGFGIQYIELDNLEKLVLLFFKDLFNYSNFDQYNLGIKIETDLIVEDVITKISATVVGKGALVVI